MTMSKNEIYDNCIEACKNGEFTYIRDHWRFLSSEEKLDIYYHSFKNKKAIFVYGQNDIEMLKEWEVSFIKQLINMEDALIYKKESVTKSKDQLAFDIVKDQLEDIIQDYAVSKEQLENVFQTHTVPDEYKVNEHRKTIYKNFAVYTRLREFAELFKKYPYLRTQAKYDYNLLKCNPRRIKARFEYMLYKNLSSGLKEIDSIDDLLLSKLDFSYIYQKEMLEVIYEWKEKDPEAHDIIWRFAHKNAKENETGESYFKYIDMAFIAAFGDEGLQKYIEQNREKSVEKAETNTQSEELKLKDIFGEPVMPRGESDDKKSYIGKGGNGKFKPNQLEKLDKQRISEFIIKAKEAGLNCDSYFTTGSGTPALGEDEVFYYLFEKDGNRFIVPVGQVGNSMYRIIDNEISMEQLKELMKHKERDDLVKDGILERRYNVRTSDSQTYDYEASLQKLINLSVLASESASHKEKKTRKTISLSDVKAQVVNAIPASDVPEVTTYVTELAGKNFIANLFNKSVADAIDTLPDEQLQNVENEHFDEQDDKKVEEQASEQKEGQNNSENTTTENRLNNAPYINVERKSNAKGDILDDNRQKFEFGR